MSEVDIAESPPSTLLDISVDAIATVLSHLGTRPRLAELLQLGAVCRDLRALMCDESIWQALCKSAWSIADADLSSEWPTLSSFRSLYAVLEVWAPRQGFHQLLEAFPWGALLLLRFAGGRFVGELIHHKVSPETGFCVAQKPVLALEVTFGAAGVNAGAESSADEQDSTPVWLRVARRPRIRWCGKDVVSCTTVTDAPHVPISPFVAGGRFFSRDPTDSIAPRRVRCRQYLSLRVDLGRPRGGAQMPTCSDGGDETSGAGEAGEADEANGADESDEDDESDESEDEDEDDEGAQEPSDPLDAEYVRAMRELWVPTAPEAKDAVHEGRRWYKRLQGLRNQITLGLVDGPAMPDAACGPAATAASAAGASGSAAAPSETDAEPQLRPGLYVGDYSHNEVYGLYGNESLLLERRSFALDGGDGHQALRALFTRTEGQAGAGQGPDEWLQAQIAEHSSDMLGRFLEWLRLAPRTAEGNLCTLLIGRKVTGDMHVPMGAATFVACLDPRLDEMPSQAMPLHIRTLRSDEERVARGWVGFGTLAYPGFQRSSWDQGWLVQLEDNAEGRRFAFVWGSRLSTRANTLTQVVAQSTACFVGENEAMRPYWPPAAPHAG
jgi:hypothetical protein